MPTPTLDTTPDGAIVVAADTAEEALSHIGARLGDDAEIVEARKVHRGGWRGFFATEAVELVARPRTSSSPSPVPPATPEQGPPDAGRGGVDAALARLTEQADDREQDFRQVLDAQLRAEPSSSSSSSSSSPASSSPASPSPTAARVAVLAERTRATEGAGDEPSGRRVVANGPAEWNADELRRLRLPNAVLAACRDLHPADDATWVAAIAGAVSTWCRPLPSQDGVLVGPRSHRLGRQLLVPIREVGAQEPRSGPVALRATDTAERRRWVDELAGGRWLHVVAGGRGWQGYLLHDVLAVSWVGDEALPEALAAAARMGLVLGYGLGRATGDLPVRANPLDVALTIRSLLPRTII